MAMSSTVTGSTVRLHTRSAFSCQAPRPCKTTRTALQSPLSSDMALSSVGRASFSRVELPSSRNTANRMVVTMAAKVTGKIKLQLPAGKANPAPPVGPALGSKGVNIMAFCKEYNAQTAKMVGEIIPVEITVYEDRSFTFILKTPPAAELLKKAAGISSGSGKPNKDKVGSVTAAQIREIAQKKIVDTNATEIDSVVKMIEGTAKSLGLNVVA